MYTLYYSPGACSMAVHIVLAEIGTDYNLKLVSVREGQNHQADYLRVNPKGRVPALAFDDQVLTEVGAILFYLAENHPEARLLPCDPLAKARCLEFIAWLSSDVHAVFKQIWRAERFSIDEGHLSAIRAKGKVNASTCMADIENRLKGSTVYAVGDRYTVVDPYLLVYYGWGRSVGLQMSQYPAFTAYIERLISARPVIQQVMEYEGLSRAA